jgi:NTP pyrophosphatase (non-canonical NTP hydrolase)
MSIEDQDSISQWSRETFGPATPTRAATRMNTEVAELLTLMSMPQSMAIRLKIEEECADVLIVLYTVANCLGIDLHHTVDEKMSINRARKWKLDGSGCGQHIEETEKTT